MSPLLEFLNGRELRDRARLVEWLYRCLPCPLARVIEKRLTIRHMRAIAPRITFLRNCDEGWTVRHGMDPIAQSSSLNRLVGTLERPVSIVATGPSARDYPWENLRDGKRFVIAVNGAPTLLSKVGILPDLLVVSDSRFARDGGEHFRNAPGVPLVTHFHAASILASRSRDQLLGRPFSLLERINSWYGLPRLPHELLVELNEQSQAPFLFPDVADSHYRIGWSHAPELGFFSGSTVVFVALQIAVRLGARDIEIIGMDLSGSGRAYEEGARARPSSLVKQYDKTILPSFEIMHRALMNKDVAVRNLSPHCPLPGSLFAS